MSDKTAGTSATSPLSPTGYRDERPKYKPNEQELAWNAPKFMVLLVATLAAAIFVIVTAANASYDRSGGWTGFSL